MWVQKLAPKKFNNVQIVYQIRQIGPTGPGQLDMQTERQSKWIYLRRLILPRLSQVGNMRPTYR